MTDTERGTWWFVEVDGERVRISHGVTVNGEVGAMRGSVGASFDAALELAVGIVHACLEIDAGRAQATMLELWLSASD